MKASDIRLIKDRLLIKPSPVESKIGSIIIPDKYRETAETGVVVAAGSGRIDQKTGSKIPMMCRVGDKVLYNKGQFEKLTLDSGEHYYLNDHEVLAVLG